MTERNLSSDAGEWLEQGNDSGAHWRRKRLAAPAGGRLLGCSLYEIDPGARHWPYHYHLANEEAIFVLAGEGVLRRPDGELVVGVGDYVTFPVGPAGAHQLRNEGDEVLRFLCISTMIDPEIAVYPDSRKLGLFAGWAPGSPLGEDGLSRFIPDVPGVDYWEGEP